MLAPSAYWPGIPKYFNFDRKCLHLGTCTSSIAEPVRATQVFLQQIGFVGIAAS
jgi:hypothetical protein